MAAATVKREGKKHTGVVWLHAFALMAVTLAAYGRVWSFEFLHYDDPLYVTGNPYVISGLSLSNIRWAFTTFAVLNWQPLTWISHMADTSMFGQGPRGPHAVNVFIHLANALLLFWVLRRMTKGEARLLRHCLRCIPYMWNPWHGFPNARMF